MCTFAPNLCTPTTLSEIKLAVGDMRGSMTNWVDNRHQEFDNPGNSLRKLLGRFHKGPPPQILVLRCCFGLSRQSGCWTGSSASGRQRWSFWSSPSFSSNTWRARGSSGLDNTTQSRCKASEWFHVRIWSSGLSSTRVGLTKYSTGHLEQKRCDRGVAPLAPTGLLSRV